MREENGTGYFSCWLQGLEALESKSSGVELCTDLSC